MGSGRGHVLITGCSTGIGRACVDHLTDLGFHCFAGVRTMADAATFERDKVTPVILDITDAPSVAAAAENARAVCGDEGLVGLVNNAGISVHGPVEHIPLADWRRQFEVNLFGHIAMTQAMLPLLRMAVAARGRGAARIVNMSSIAGLIAQPIIAPYNASKFALEAVSDSLRLELRGQGIKVCLVEPGAIDTPIWAKAEANPGAFPPDHPARKLYAREIDAIVNAARKSAAAAISPIAVAKAVAACLTRRRPRIRTLVGTDARIGAAAKWLLPTKVLDAGMSWAMGR